MFLDYLALGLLIFASLAIFYGVIAIHDIPYEIAHKRNHPHAEAIHYAGWVSLFTLHVIWPFLWIWATLWHPEYGWGTSQNLPKHRQPKALQEEAERAAAGEPAAQAKQLIAADKLPELEADNRKLNEEIALLRREMSALANKMAALETPNEEKKV